jgi:glycosyltransferase involved in cell wall biosynthesis
MTEELLPVDADLFDDSDLFIKPQKKRKILFISDHPLAPSGVGVQARMLINGLLATGRYSFLCLGGAMKHGDYRTIVVNEDFIVKPVDNFGTRELVQQILVQESIDAILLFTDPRQFVWLWEFADEVQQVCPITYWHVWDNDPYPAFNRPWYESTDLINCLSWKTFEMVHPHFPEKTYYVPHTWPKEVFFPIPPENRNQLLVQNFGERWDWFKVLWVNRNATRKMPGDLLDSWQRFLAQLEEKHGHRQALLIMHTDPGDGEGPNLPAMTELLGITPNVMYSTDKYDFDRMNILHNFADAYVNVSKNEGFGLGVLSSMQCGIPAIALKTGGETRKIVDWRDGTEHGVALEPSKRSLVGSQLVPYIYEDFFAQEELAEAFMTIYEMTPEERTSLSQKCKDYVDFEFAYPNMIESWDRTLTACIDSFKEKGVYRQHRWTFEEITSVTKTKPLAGIGAPQNAVAQEARKKELEQEHAMDDYMTQLTAPAVSPPQNTPRVAVDDEDEDLGITVRRELFSEVGGE